MELQKHQNNVWTFIEKNPLSHSKWPNFFYSCLDRIKEPQNEIKLFLYSKQKKIGLTVN